MMAILNSTTGIENKYPINEFASSHLFRDTFIGNL